MNVSLLIVGANMTLRQITVIGTRTAYYFSVKSDILMAINEISESSISAEQNSILETDSSHQSQMMKRQSLWTSG
jgi:DNA polymerase IIIc chi subunit